MNGKKTHTHRTKLFSDYVFLLFEKKSCCLKENQTTPRPSEHPPVIRAVLIMGTKSCTKILNFSTRFSCENLAVEDFVWEQNLVQKS